MGNVSSSDHDRVNELLSRKVKRRPGSGVGRKKKHEQQEPQQQRQQQQELQLLHQYQEVNQPQLHPQQQLQHPEQNLSEQLDGPVSPVLSPTKDFTRQGSFHIHRQRTSPDSLSKVPQPLRSDDFAASKRTSLSQADFYSRAKPEYSPMTPTSPATPYSITSSTTVTSASNQIYDSYTVISLPSKQEPSPGYYSAPIVIPQQISNQASDNKHGSANSLDNNLNGPSISPRHYDFDRYAHYRQQQKQLSSDLRLIGTSPEAKEWLKQKPTRSATHLLHQYNFQSHQYYQPPGSAKASNGVSRSLSAHVSTSSKNNLGASANNNPTESESNHMVPPAEQGPSFINAAAATIATDGSSGIQLVADQGHASEIKESASALLPPTLPADLVQIHFDGHFYGHGHGISTPYTPHPSPAEGRRREPGRLVMSRSKLGSPTMAAAPMSAPIITGGTSFGQGINSDT
ncbi:hypothetical protein BC939DRAFT_469645 [Gamsiella multidivaricata]|uniref:uncharacterized protein n=1 Tax=Gamsiella multidivaricata TaxID=101098 RepID=UPI00221F0932|nr:uncharacterized protein BC939DRAFT_469645 [Gamsiella multidivaricata]KAG0359384.1 hypothetical protein BGZ54_009974 [Gamsiella multidivaricata]KAI7816257.1 hypothetical protein BC939DRAFT_469645 [Gamsiella multidivaricata]